MTTSLRLRRGTTTQHSTFTGAAGEVTIDTTKNTIVVHDGSTAGGIPLAKESVITGAVRYDSAQTLNAAQKTQARSNIGAAAVPSANGIVVQTAADTMDGRAITAGSGISVTNGDGVAGNPTIANSGVLSIGGTAGAIALGSGLSMAAGVLSNSAASPAIGIQLFTASGTFTVPTGVSAVKVTVVGGGGGGASMTTTNGAGNGGGGGGAAIKYINGLTPGATVAVTVGAGGSAGAGGGSSSFGAYCSATGGAGGSSNVAVVSKTSGGVGTGGYLNLTGGPGWCAGGAAGGAAVFNVTDDTGVPGCGLFGGTGGGYPAAPAYSSSTNGISATGYGNGGSGARRNVGGSGTGGSGSGGVVIVEW